eukprot:g29404.t2
MALWRAQKASLTLPIHTLASHLGGIHGWILKGIQVDYNKEKMSTDEIERFWSSVKGKAIARECNKFYSQYEGQSWKNVISIGDSDFERLGTQHAMENYMRETGIHSDGKLVDVNGHLYKVRTKTFKMLDEPTVEELTVEVDMLKAWLPLMVKLDSSFDVPCFGSKELRAAATMWRTDTGAEVLTLDSPSCQVPSQADAELRGSITQRGLTTASICLDARGTPTPRMPNRLTVIAMQEASERRKSKVKSMRRAYSHLHAMLEEDLDSQRQRIREQFKARLLERAQRLEPLKKQLSMLDEEV